MKLKINRWNWIANAFLIMCLCWSVSRMCIVYDIKEKIGNIEKMKEKDCEWSKKKDVLFSKIYLLQFDESLPALIPFGFCENTIIFFRLEDLYNLLEISMQFAENSYTIPLSVVPGTVFVKNL